MHSNMMPIQIFSLPGLFSLHHGLLGCAPILSEAASECNRTIMEQFSLAWNSDVMYSLRWTYARHHPLIDLPENYLQKCRRIVR